MDDQNATAAGVAEQNGIRPVRRPPWQLIEDWAGPAVCYVALVAMAWWGSSIFASQSPLSVAKSVVISTASATPRPSPIAPSPAPAVRIVNPFDATEVFEFPAGTTDAQSRVAQLLLQRAKDRRDQWAMAARGSLRTANNL